MPYPGDLLDPANPYASENPLVGEDYDAYSARRDTIEAAQAQQSAAQAAKQQADAQSQAQSDNAATAKAYQSQGIASYTASDGGIRALMDPWVNAPMQGDGSPGGIAYDSKGNAQRVSYPALDSPKLSDAYSAEGGGSTTTDAAGNIYKTSPGLPYQWSGTDPDVQAQAQADQAAKDDAAQQKAQRQAVIDAHTAAAQQVATSKADLASHQALLDANTTKLRTLPELSDPDLDLDGDGIADKLDQNFAPVGDQYSQHTGFFGGGNLTKDSQQAVDDLNARKTQAQQLLAQRQQTQGNIADTTQALTGAQQQLKAALAARSTFANQEMTSAGLSTGSDDDDAASANDPAATPIDGRQALQTARQQLNASRVAFNAAGVRNVTFAPTQAPSGVEMGSDGTLMIAPAALGRSMTAARADFAQAGVQGAPADLFAHVLAQNNVPGVTSPLANAQANNSAQPAVTTLPADPGTAPTTASGTPAPTKSYTVAQDGTVQFDQTNPTSSVLAAYKDGLIDDKTAASSIEAAKKVEAAHGAVASFLEDHPQIASAAEGLSTGGAFLAGGKAATLAATASGLNPAIAAGSVELGPFAWIPPAFAGAAEFVGGGMLASYAKRKLEGQLADYSDAVKALQTGAKAYPKTAAIAGVLPFLPSAVSSIGNLADVGGIAADGLGEAATTGQKAAAAATAVGKQVGVGAAGGAAVEGIVRPAVSYTADKVLDAAGIQHDPTEAPTVSSVLQMAALGALTAGHGGLDINGVSDQQLGSVLIRGAAHEENKVPFDKVIPSENVAARYGAYPEMSADDLANVGQPLTPAEQELYAKAQTRMRQLYQEGNLPNDFTASARQVTRNGKPIGVASFDFRSKQSGDAPSAGTASTNPPLLSDGQIPASPDSSSPHGSPSVAPPSPEPPRPAAPRGFPVSPSGISGAPSAQPAAPPVAGQAPSTAAQGQQPAPPSDDDKSLASLVQTRNDTQLSLDQGKVPLEAVEHTKAMVAFLSQRIADANAERASSTPPPSAEVAAGQSASTPTEPISPRTSPAPALPGTTSFGGTGEASAPLSADTLPGAELVQNSQTQPSTLPPDHHAQLADLVHSDATTDQPNDGPSTTFQALRYIRDAGGTVTPDVARTVSRQVEAIRNDDTLDAPSKQTALKQVVLNHAPAAAAPPPAPAPAPIERQPNTPEGRQALTLVGKFQDLLATGKKLTANQEGAFHDALLIHARDLNRQALGGDVPPTTPQGQAALQTFDALRSKHISDRSPAEQTRLRTAWLHLEADRTRQRLAIDAQGSESPTPASAAPPAQSQPTRLTEPVTPQGREALRIINGLQGELDSGRTLTPGQHVSLARARNALDRDLTAQAPDAPAPAPFKRGDSVTYGGHPAIIHGITADGLRAGLRMRGNPDFVPANISDLQRAPEASPTREDSPAATGETQVPPAQRFTPGDKIRLAGRELSVTADDGGNIVHVADQSGKATTVRRTLALQQRVGAPTVLPSHAVSFSLQPGTPVLQNGRPAIVRGSDASGPHTIVEYIDPSTGASQGRGRALTNTLAAYDPAAVVRPSAPSNSGPKPATAPGASVALRPNTPDGIKAQATVDQLTARQAGQKGFLTDSDKAALNNARENLDRDLNRQVLGPNPQPRSPDAQHALARNKHLQAALEMGARLPPGDHAEFNRNRQIVESDFTKQRRAIATKQAQTPAVDSPAREAVASKPSSALAGSIITAKAAARTAQEGIHANRAMLKELGVRTVEYGPTKSASGIELREDGTLQINSEKLAASLTTVRSNQVRLGIDSTPEEWFAQTLAHEAVHAADVEVAKSKGQSIAQRYDSLPSEAMPTGWEEAGRQAYGAASWDALPEWNKKAEFVRQVVEGKWTGRISEALYKFIREALDFIKRTAGFNAADPRFKAHVEEVESRIQGGRNKVVTKPPRSFKMPSSTVGGGADVLDHIAENGGMVSPRQAQLKPTYSKFQGDYDGAPTLGGYYHHAVFGGKVMPDQMAQTLHEEHGVGDGSVDGMWKAISNAVDLRRKVAVQRQSEATQAKQAGRFDKDALTPNTSKGKTEVNTSNLSVGDKVQVGNQTLKVVGIDPDTLDVELEDHSRYGVQTVADNTALYVEKVEPGNNSSLAAARPDTQTGHLFAGDDEPFTLRGEPAPEAMRLAAAQARASAPAAESKLPTLRSGEKGTGDLFQQADQPFNLAGETATDHGALAAARERTAQESALARAKQDAQQLDFTTVQAPGPASVSEPETSTPRAVAPRPSAAITDFGEKIDGARKDRWGKFGRALETGLPDDVADITLSKHFPEPDYEKLLADGVPERDLAAMKALRDLIPPKPQVNYKLARWGQLVKGMHEAMKQLVSPDGVDASHKIDAILGGSRQFTNQVGLYRSLGYPAFTKAKDWSLKDGSFSTFMGKNYSPPKTIAYAQNKGRMQMDISSEASTPAERTAEIAAKVKARIDAAASQTPAARETQFGVYTDRYTNEAFIGKKGLNGVVRIKTGFKNAKEALDYRDANQQKLRDKWEEMKAPPTLRRAANNPREGVARHEGDVAPEQFQDAFGFRGVQFGNYVEGPRRQADLNEAFDALTDLADTLGVPTKALSLDGSLGLAFGARGGGTAKAHYEPGEVVINLTKTQGPGSLAHEWFHALDNYFARLDRTGDTTPKPVDAYGTRETAPPKNMRPTVWQAFKGIRDMVNKGDFSKRSNALDATRTKPYYGTTIEKAARAFETYVEERLAKTGITNDYLVNIDKAGSDAYPTAPELDGGIRGAYDQLFNTLDTKQTDRGTALFAAKPEDESGASESSKPLLPGDAVTYQGQRFTIRMTDGSRAIIMPVGGGRGSRAAVADLQRSPAQAQTPDPSRGESIKAVVDDALTPGTGERKRYADLGTVSAGQAAQLKTATGLDLSGYRRNLDNSAIRHVWREHGDPAAEVAKGNAPLTREDFEKLPQILAQPDASILAGKNSRGQDVIMHAKRVNGHFVVAEEVRDGRGILSLSTLYKKSAPPLASGPGEPNAALLQSNAQAILRQAADSFNFLHGGESETPALSDRAQRAQGYIAELEAKQARQPLTAGEQGTLDGARKLVADELATNAPEAHDDPTSLGAARPEDVTFDPDDDTPAADETSTAKKGSFLQRARAEIAKRQAEHERSDSLSAHFDAADTMANVAGRHERTSIRLDFDRGTSKEAQRAADLDRQAATAALEAGGQRPQLVADLARVKASPDKALAARYAPVYEHALAQLSDPAKLKAFQDRLYNFRQIDTEQAALRERAGLPPSKEGRMTRVHDDPLSPQATIARDRGLHTVPGHKTIANAIAAGVDPKTMDLADIVGQRVYRNQRDINQKAYQGELGSLKASDGKPLLSSIEENSTALNPDGSVSSTVRVPRNYQAVQAGDNVLVAHKDIAPLLKAQYGESAIANHWLGNKALDYAALIKHGAIGIDTFHAAQVALRGALGFGTTGWSKGVAGLDFADKDLDRAVKAGKITQKQADDVRESRRVDRGLLAEGLNVGKATDNLLEAARQANLIDRIPVVGPVAKATAEFTFHKLQPAYMMQAARIAYARNKARFPEKSDGELFRRSAKEINEFYGSLGTQGVLKSKTLQDAAKFVFFAPSFTEGRARTEARGLGQFGHMFVDGVRGKGWRVGVVAQAMGGIILAGLVGSQIVNMISRGKPTWDNPEEGHRFDAWLPGGKHGFFFSPLSLAAEYSHALLKYIEGGQSPLDALAHIASNKLAGGARAAKDLLTGKDDQGRAFGSTAERLKAAALDAAPLPMAAGALLKKDPKSPIGLSFNHQSGSMEKQALGMAGLRVDNAPSPRAQMYALAEPYRAKTGGTLPPSDYTGLRHALDNEDRSGAQDEIRGLLREGKSLAQVARALGLNKDGQTTRYDRFTGSTQDVERAFLAKLTPPQKTIARQARKDQDDAISLFRKYSNLLLATDPKARHQAEANAARVRAAATTGK